MKGSEVALIKFKTYKCTDETLTEPHSIKFRIYIM